MEHRYSSPTAEQAAAIAVRDRDVFCEAGAGSGKTRVLVGRYCDAVVNGEARIDEVLAFTFTERAAAELRQRIRRELGRRSREAAAGGDEFRAAELRGLARETERAWVTTIHGFCRRLLGRHPVAAGLDPRFRVIDAPAAERLRGRAAREALRELVEAGDEAVMRAAAAYKPWRLGNIALAAHERLRSQGMAHPRLPEVPEPRRSPEGDAPLTPEQRHAALDARAALERVLETLDRRYEGLKGTRSGLDFADLELRAVEVLRGSEAVRELWRGRFRHLMVDEFQDTNRVQLELIDALSGPDTRLFTVGDEHQSIYRFRNADLEVFRAERRAAKESATTEVRDLRGNFRSRPPVLAAANLVGATLLEGFTPLTSGRAADPADPQVELMLTLNEGRGASHRKWKDHEESLRMPPSESIPATVAQARALAERLRTLVDAGEAAPGEIVVLLRAFTHVDAYDDALRRFGLEPYVVGGRGYWSQQQVEDLLRLLSVIANPLDDEVLFGALASPANEVSPDALWLLRAAVGAGPIWPTVERTFGEGDSDFEPEDPDRLGQIPEEDEARLRRFCAILPELRAEAPLLPLDALVERTMNAFGYDLALLARSQPAGRMANVRKLMRLAAEFERTDGRDLRSFLAQAAEATKRDEREGLAPVQAEGYDGVRIMTVHGAKGLEFPVVAVPELDRRLDVAHQPADIWIGRPELDGSPARFGLRLAFPTAQSLGAWELTELDAEEKEAEAEESCRLVYVAATRAQERLILSGVYKPDDLEPCELKTSQTAIQRLLPRLADLGWSGGEETVELPPPEPALEGTPAAAAARLRVSISEPGEERSLELGRELAPVRDATDRNRGGVPPILDPARSNVPLGHLSYSALDAYKRCGYRFYVERVLGVRAGLGGAVSSTSDDAPREDADPDLAPGDELAEPAPDEAPERPPTAALALGNAVHAALEWSARRDWAAPDDEHLAALMSHEGIVGEEAFERARRLVDGWLASPLRAELGARPANAEAPFVLPLAGTILRGSIDLLVRDDDGATVVDYKTDHVGSTATAVVGERYAAQRAVYALAAAGRSSGVVRAAHVFLERPDEPVVEAFDSAAREAARGRLGELIERIRSGAFEPAREPYAALCFGCPAAPRLCPRPAWRPRRDAPAALR
jgi:ATP-dependent exoDNAse (exonuclease V) beta subunit